MGHQELVSLFETQAESNSALFKAVKEGEIETVIETVKELLLKGAQVTARSESWATPLHNACAKGNNELVCLLLKSEAAVNAQENKGSGGTPLHWATGSSCVALIPLLCSHGADIHCTDRYGLTALHWAARVGAIDMVRALIEAGAKINEPSYDGKTPLYLAAQAEETARFLLAHGGLLGRYDRTDTEPFYQPPNGHTMKACLKVQTTLDSKLFKAVKSGNLVGVETLLSKGARVNARDTSLRTPLHYAAQKGYLKIVLLLIEQGARIRVQDAKNKTPYRLADKGYHKQIASLLKNHNPLNGELFNAVREDNLGSAQELLKRGAHVNARNNLQQTPLHCAASLGLETIVELVLVYGADLTTTDHTGKTALDWATSKNHKRIMKRLRWQQRKDEELFRAINRGIIKDVECLLTKGARVMARNAQQRTPLHAASFHGLDTIILLLLEQGADPCACDENGFTPLKLASRNLPKKIRELLAHHKRDH